MGLRRLFERRPPSPPLGEGLSPNDLLDGLERQPGGLVINSADAGERTPLFAAFQRARGSGPYYEREHEDLGKDFHDDADAPTPSWGTRSRHARHGGFRRVLDRPRAYAFSASDFQDPNTSEDFSNRYESAGSNERQLEPVDFSNVFVRSANQLYRDMVAVLKLAVNLLMVSVNQMFQALAAVLEPIGNLFIPIFHPLTFFLLLPPIGLCTILGLLIINRCVTNK